MEYLFVYGTLKQGQSNHALLSQAQFVQSDTVAGRLYFFGHQHFPYAVCASSALLLTNDTYRGEIPRIQGEVYQIFTELLERLDRVEGTPIHYVRFKQYQTDKGLRVWVYESSEMTRLRATRIEVLPDGFFPSGMEAKSANSNIYP